MRKAQLRHQLRAERDALSARDAAAAARAVGELVAPLLNDVHVVAGFSATQNELDLTALYNQLLGAGTTLCFPRVAGPGAMDFVPVPSLDALTEGAFGIGEPHGEPIAIEAIEVFLVPGLAFDSQGTRLGFGGGYYDRALRRRGEVGEKVPLLIGIGYSCQVLKTTLPVDDWDVPMDLVITESGIIRVA